MRKRTKKKKMETSKILLIVSDVMAVSVLIGTLVAVFTLRDAGPLEYLIVGAFGLASASHGFYYWKAKAENMKKLGWHEDKVEEDIEG